jgi:integrase
MKRTLGHIEKLPSGKYLLRLSAQHDDFGNRIQLNKTIEAKNDRDAEKALFDFYAEREKLRDEKLTKAPETLGELYDEWMQNHVKKQLRPKTAQFYDSLWENHIKKYSKSRIKTFSVKMLNEIIDAAIPIKQKKKDGDLRKSNNSGDRLRKGVFVLLRALFGKAVQWGYVVSNPCVRIDTPQYHAKEKEIYTLDEISAIIKIVDQEAPKYQALFYFAALCGMRRGEIVGLQWNCIDFDKMTFEIKQAATRTTGATTEGKTKAKESNRSLTLPEALYPILKKIKVEQNETQLLLGEKWHDGDFVFTQWDGRLMCVDTPSNWWTKMRKRHPEFPQAKTLHTLRHTMATYMIVSGVPVSTVSGTLGHAQQSTTLNIYSKVVKDAKKEAMQNYEAQILKKKTVQ